jgi:molybdopterin converting factor small subunit
MISRMSASKSVTVEFFGVPRQRAGRSELAVVAGSVAELLAEVERACPQFAGLLFADGRLSSHYLLSLDGKQFVNDLRQELQPGSRVLLLSADAGG